MQGYIDRLTAANTPAIAPFRPSGTTAPGMSVAARMMPTRRESISMYRARPPIGSVVEDRIIATTKKRA